MSSQHERTAQLPAKPHGLTVTQDLPHQTQIDEGGKATQCDILIIGGGAAGLAAAAAADHVGGTTFRSGGTIWMPNNFLLRKHGIEDSKALGARYINAVTQAIPTPSRRHAADAPLRSRRVDAFLTQGPEMINFFRDQGFRWMSTPSKFPDYHPNADGAVEQGRTLDPAVFDAACLGPYLKYLPAPDGAPVVARFEDFRILTRPHASAHCTDLSPVPKGMSRPMSMGRSVVAQLLKICMDRGNVEIWTRACGILYFGKQTRKEWSLSSDGDTGIALQVGQNVGADSRQLDEVWGIPTMNDPRTGQVTEAMFAISKPFSVVVDDTGHRFFAESQPYGDAVRSMYARVGAGADARKARFWLIVDRTYSRRYTIGSLKPTMRISEAVDRGLILTSSTISDLEKQMDIQDGALQATLYRWNAMCVSGKDEDYGRGEDRYQQFIGDPGVGPNPCMGPVKTSPFYAIEIFPGDAGTRGGLRSDEFARALRKDGDVIRRLYVAGNASAATLGSHGAGTTICPAMTDGFIAVRHIQALDNGSSGGDLQC
ncbi:FAD binding domain-containing protein [Ilyonectria robusta]|uniref:FAD binding domain-containing protein n=1 Tax=Ilyonectria robusta TaxID=1079257 RepID=UPI001E8E43F7|nr:FAD binding domain-containing protein [Ilyonectria robusta]KAH8648818.1 FAD binding domain-containing protein [Ilyonectria robusta]